MGRWYQCQLPFRHRPQQHGEQPDFFWYRLVWLPGHTCREQHHLNMWAYVLYAISMQTWTDYVLREHHLVA